MHTFELKGGFETYDRRLDRIPQFDDRSRNFPVTALIDTRRPRSYAWRLSSPFVIDQGNEGACVGFGVTNELMARPSEVRWADKYSAEHFARTQIYWPAQFDDPWPGGAYPGASPFYEGTSVLAGMMVARRDRWFREVRWGFGLRDVVLGIGYNGPAVLGIDWYSSMYSPVGGIVEVSGTVVGGHCILARAVRVFSHTPDLGGSPETWDQVDLEKSYAVLRNSWGADWGHGGDAKIRLTDLDRLLKAGGEAAFAVGRVTRTPHTP